MRYASFLLLLAVVLPVGGADLLTLDNKQLKGDIVSIANGELTFRTGGGEEKMLVTTIDAVNTGIVVKPIESGSKFIAVELIDGSQFIANSLSFAGKNLILDMFGGRKLTVPLTSVYFLLRDAQDLKLEQDFRNLLKTRSKFDIWVTRKKSKGDNGKDIDSLDGVLGTFGDADVANESIKFTLESTGSAVNVKWNRIQGMIFNQIPTTTMPAICRVVDSSNNSYVAQGITVTATGYKIRTVSGFDVELPKDQVSKFDFKSGSVKYLSDLDPISSEESGTDPERYQKDKTLDKGAIRFDVKAKDGVLKDFRKGISLHAKTVLIYELKGQYKFFKALAGVDASVETPSQCRLTIETGGQPLFKGIIKKGDAPVDLNLNVQGADRLRIIVESEGTLLDLGNQLTLAEDSLLK